jgi:hypothetical protein
MSSPDYIKNLRAAKCFGVALPKKEAPKKEKKPQKPLKKNTPKRAKQEREYSKKRKEFLSLNKICLVAVAGCTKEATQIHHMAGRIGNKLTDKKDFLPCCGNCHDFLEANPLTAKEMQFSKSRLKK